VIHHGVNELMQAMKLTVIHNSKSEHMDRRDNTGVIKPKLFFQRNKEQIQQHY
jgi:hypothetical protein